MEYLIHSPAFNCAKMAWVAGVGGAKVPREDAARSREVPPEGLRGAGAPLGEGRAVPPALRLGILRLGGAPVPATCYFCSQALLYWHTSPFFPSDAPRFVI